MRIVVYPHLMEIGGSQLNAIELAAGVRDLGHDVIVFGQPGPLTERVAELDLEFVAAPLPHRRPSPRVMRELTELVRTRSVDLVHGYEWTTAMEAYWGPRTRLGVPAVGTVMSMAVAPFLPFNLPLVVGTQQIAAHERARGRELVDVIEPPVDLEHNDPALADPAAFRREWGLDPDVATVVCVTRLAAELKLEGILAAIDVVADLPPECAAQLVLVGDGPTRETVEAHAAAANARAGRRVVVLTGELPDPRDAYAAADVCLAMGGSALRGMAFGRPLIVQGEQGFWELLEPDTAKDFLWTGWYGVGPGAEHGREALRVRLEPLLRDDARRDELGRYARWLVEERFSLTSASARQLELYEAATADPLTRWAPLTPRVTSASRFASYEVSRRVQRVLRHTAADDFNAKPVAAAPGAARPSRFSASGRWSDHPAGAKS